jgi:nucleotide-binding universal stress UspA family protein
MKTNKILKVLIALDYNPTAQKVAESGFSMAKAMKADVTLLHVISDPLYYASPEYSPIMGFSGFLDTGPFLTDNVDGLKEAAMQYLDKTRHHLGDKTIHTRIAEGEFAESILKTAKKTHADIIILGSHSRKWLENVLIGSVTEKVLRQSSIPLIIIPTKKQG